MRGSFRRLLAVAALAALPLLPAAVAAELEPGSAPNAAETPATGAEEAPADGDQIADEPASDATADGAASDEDGNAAQEDAGADASDEAEAPGEPKELEGYTGIVEKVMADGLVVRRTGRGTDPRALPVVRFSGGLAVEVTGKGKGSWLSLRRGDLVVVSYRKGPPAQAQKVNVLRTTADRARRFVRPRTKPDHRTFIGYVKKKDGDELIVMNPPAPDPRTRAAEIKAFVRQEHTSVEVLRDSWDDIQKGDRLKIEFQKGNPRPVDRILVIWRGGEKPLPPGTATRLFHPDYDSSVKDVDGIGEIGPVPPAVKLPGATRRIRRPRPDSSGD